MVLLSEDTLDRVFSAAYEVAAVINHLPDVVISSGSGLDKIWERYNLLQKINYEDIPNMPKSEVEGHSNELLIIEYEGKIAMVFAGRFHLYEGHNLESVMLPIFLPYLYGVKNYLFLNSAGGLNHNYQTGDIMLITSTINFTFKKIVHMFKKEIFGINNIAKNLFNEEWIKKFENQLVSKSIPYQKGTYIAVTGPSYETPAEVRFFRRIKGDAIGMSTVLELLAGNLLGVNQLAVSTITNMLTENYGYQTNHTQVLESVNQNLDKIHQVINAAIETIP